MSASDFFKDKDKLKAALEVVAGKAIQSQLETLEECVEDTGKCGMGGYCKTCPHTNNKVEFKREILCVSHGGSLPYGLAHECKKCLKNQREKYMTNEQENKYLRQVLVDLWLFFGEERNADDYIHDLDQIRGKVFNNLVKQEELNQISVAIRLADDAKVEEIKRVLEERYPPMNLTDR